MTTAVVTGSAGGIGSATVRAFEATGFTVRGLDVDDDPARSSVPSIVSTRSSAPTS